MAVRPRRFSPAILAGLFLLLALGLAMPVSAQAENGSAPAAGQEESESPNGHEIESLPGNESGLDQQVVVSDDTDVDVGGFSISFVFFVLGALTALAFIGLFIYKFFLHKP